MGVVQYRLVLAQNEYYAESLNNSLGVYDIAAADTISNVRVFFADVKSGVMLQTVQLGDQNQDLGFFIAQDGVEALSPSRGG